MPVNPKSLKNLRPSKKGMTNNPNGQPRKWVSLVNKALEEEWYSPASKRDIEENYMQMLQLPQEKLLAMGKDKNQPMLVRIVAKNMLSWKGFDIIEKMLDRWIGKAIQTEKHEWEITLKKVEIKLPQE